MRKLTKKQQKFLDTLPVCCVDDMTTEEWDTLEAMNDTEILYHEANNYLSDTLENKEHMKIRDKQAEEKKTESYTQKLERMLLNLFDAHYGMSYHHCGDGDGLNPEDASEIAEFAKHKHNE